MDFNVQPINHYRRETAQYFTLNDRCTADTIYTARKSSTVQTANWTAFFSPATLRCAGWLLITARPSGSELVAAIARRRGCCNFHRILMECTPPALPPPRSSPHFPIPAASFHWLCVSLELFCLFLWTHHNESRVDRWWRRRTRTLMCGGLVLIIRLRALNRSRLIVANTSAGVVCLFLVFFFIIYVQLAV